MKNLRIQYKIALIFIIILVLMANLGALSILAIYNIRNNTEKVTSEFLPRVVKTSELKDQLNLSIAYAYDYVRTGKTESKTLYEARNAELAQRQSELFALAKTTEDFQFIQTFQGYIDGINAAEKDLISAYESGTDTNAIEEKQALLTQQRDAFITFLDNEIQTRVENESSAVEQQAQQQLQRTIVLTLLASGLALITMIALFWFVRRSITDPLGQLTRMAQNIGMGNFNTSSKLVGRDELGILGKTLNSMSEHIQQAQRALEEELEKTKQLDKQKTEFLSIAAHQLRTPMSGIKWVVQMTLDGDFGELPKEAHEQMQKAAENVDRMIQLINSLLDVSRLDTQGLDFSFEQADVMAMLHEAEEDLYQAAEKNGVTITTIPPTQPLPLVRVDKERMTIVFHNLIDNAVKYTPKGGRIAVGARQEGDVIVVAVADTGYGIPKAEQARLFTKFFRASNIQAVQADGSGLGLYMVNEIVRRHGGEIQVVSIEGKGTTFRVRIPITGPSTNHPAIAGSTGIDPIMEGPVKTLRDGDTE